MVDFVIVYVLVCCVELIDDDMIVVEGKLVGAGSVVIVVGVDCCGEELRGRSSTLK